MLCDDCLRELRDPADRRFGYPYINCTNCGPRYSIIRQLPYDRVHTTMADWPMCAACRREYENPADRRYHAQPIACPDCGPIYRLEETGAAANERDSAGSIRRAAELLREGRIIAIKGIGGYHLACDAGNAAAVAQLRARKFRKEQPFAVMVRSADEAREFVELADEHERLLRDMARSIVLARKKVALTNLPSPLVGEGQGVRGGTGSELTGVAPDNASLGVMLPYTPLHYLLFDSGAPSPLVLTSGNHSSEPIAYRDDDARSRLAGIADALLIGEREIARRVDDSVVAVRRGRPLMIRRSRGLAPAVVCKLPIHEPILAARKRPEKCDRAGGRRRSIG